MKNKSFLVLLSFFAFHFTSFAQYNTINTSVPFLMISPSTRSASMGDIGVASANDASAAFWNPGQLIMAANYSGVTVSHTPWLQGLTKGISLTSAYGFIDPTQSEDKKQILAASYRYFSRGDLKYTDANGNEVGTYRPADFAVDFTYSRLIAEDTGLGLTFRVISSSLGSAQIFTDQTVLKRGLAFAIDLGYYKSLVLGDNEARKLSLGISILNFGSKIQYTDHGYGTFLPTTLKMGTAYKIGADPAGVMYTFGIEFNKLLVPTPPLYSESGEIIAGMSSNVSVFTGIIQSFHDAPGGFKEELNEIQGSFGGECAVNNRYFFRTGLSMENKQKGYRNYATLGLGYKLNLSSNQIALDGGYLIPFESRSPLKNTFRISASVFIDK